MKIRLFTAPWEYGGEETSNIYPLGISYLGAVLEKNGHDAFAYNLSNNSWQQVEERITKIIKEEKPDVIGVSVLSNNRISSLKILELAKKINPKIITLAGGIHTSFMFEQMLKNYPQIDYVVRGEAEETIIELLNAIKNNKKFNSLKQIKGIAFKDKGEIIATPPRARITNLDSIPMMKHEYYKDQIKKYGIAYIITSRGCPFNCTFCPSSAYWGRISYRRSAENIFQEINYLVKNFPYLKRICIADDEFIIDNKRVIDLCKMIIDRGLKIEWECIGRVTSVTEELIKWMKKANCASISFGIESGSQRILNDVRKHVKLEQIIKAYDICAKNKLKAGVMLITGLPGEDKNSVSDTIKLLKRIKNVGEPGILQLYPGTDVYRIAKEKKLLNDDYWLTNKPIPLYICEHSKMQLWWWSFKVGLVGHIFASKERVMHHLEGGLQNFIYRKIISQMKPAKAKVILRKYILRI